MLFSHDGQSLRESILQSFSSPLQNKVLNQFEIIKKKSLKIEPVGEAEFRELPDFFDEFEFDKTEACLSMFHSKLFWLNNESLL